MAAFRKPPPDEVRISRGATWDADSWDTVIDELEPNVFRVKMTAKTPAEEWWQGGAFMGADWRSRLEFRASQALQLNASDAWWLRARLDYQFAKLAAELGVGRHPPAMVRMR